MDSGTGLPGMTEKMCLPHVDIRLSSYIVCPKQKCFFAQIIDVARKMLYNYVLPAGR
jgi:hypothetical protein